MGIALCSAARRPVSAVERNNTQVYAQRRAEWSGGSTVRYDKYRLCSLCVDGWVGGRAAGGLAAGRWTNWLASRWADQPCRSYGALQGLTFEQRTLFSEVIETKLRFNEVGWFNEVI